MPRKITISQQDIQDIVTNIEETLKDPSNLTLTKKLTIDIDLTKNEDALPPIVYITPEAFCKMKILVQKANDEIGWHGVMERLDKETYLISDILLYPQTVSGTTVTVDETKLANWQMTIPDEVFNNLRMQGHSHVNMAATPSGLDVNTYEKLLQGLDKTDGFYLMLILNKNGDCYKLLYDFAQNAIFENKEITLQCLLTDGENTLEDWYAENTTDNITKQIINTPTALNIKSYMQTPGKKTNWKQTYQDQLDEIAEEYEEQERNWVNDYYTKQTKGKKAHGPK